MREWWWWRKEERRRGKERKKKETRWRRNIIKIICLTPFLLSSFFCERDWKGQRKAIIFPNFREKSHTTNKEDEDPTSFWRVLLIKGHDPISPSAQEGPQLPMTSCPVLCGSVTAQPSTQASVTEVLHLLLCQCYSSSSCFPQSGTRKSFLPLPEYGIIKFFTRKIKKISDPDF